MMAYYLQPPPIEVPIYHHLLKTRALLWTSPELARSLAQLVTRLAQPQPTGDLLACILADLENHYDDLGFLEGEVEAWGELGKKAFPTRHTLGQIRTQLKTLIGQNPSSRSALLTQFPLTPIKAWFNCWTDPETARAIHCLGNAAMYLHAEADDSPPYVPDSLNATMAGLVCDLPLLAGHLEYLATTLSEVRGDLVRMGQVIRQEADRLHGIFASV